MQLRPQQERIDIWRDRTKPWKGSSANVWWWDACEYDWWDCVSEVELMKWFDWLVWIEWFGKSWIGCRSEDGQANRSWWWWIGLIKLWWIDWSDWDKIWWSLRSSCWMSCWVVGWDIFFRFLDGVRQLTSNGQEPFSSESPLEIRNSWWQTEIKKIETGDEVSI